ncbi:MAG TPA: hypothetical protein VFG53_10805 [Anaeromyxobacter sp.]|nr:hypothetical protein [Anaeromyxobacter sp.]
MDPGEVPAPRATLDLSCEEVLGAVAGLVERLEMVSAQLDLAMKARVGERAAEALEWAAAASTARARTEFERSAEQAERRLAAVALEVAEAARGLESSRAFRLYSASAGIALLSAIAGGGIVVLAHLAGLW